MACGGDFNEYTHYIDQGLKGATGGGFKLIDGSYSNGADGMPNVDLTKEFISIDGVFVLGLDAVSRQNPCAVQSLSPLACLKSLSAAVSPLAQQ